MAKAARAKKAPRKVRQSRKPKAANELYQKTDEDLRSSLFLSIYHITQNVNEAIDGSATAFMFIKKPELFIQGSSQTPPPDISAGTVPHKKERKHDPTSQALDNAPGNGAVIAPPAAPSMSEEEAPPAPKKHFETDRILM